MARTYVTISLDESKAIEGVRKEMANVITFPTSPEALERLAQQREINRDYEKGRDHLRSEMGILAHRDDTLQSAQDRIHALELKVKEEFPVERLMAATDPTDNQALYEELCRLENSYINQIITQDYTAGARVEEQRGLASIVLRKFIVSKVELCYGKSIPINNKTLKDHILKDTELRLNDLRKQISALFNEAREIAAHDPGSLQSFVEDMTLIAVRSATPGFAKAAKPLMPEAAPELYKERPKQEIDGRLRKERPVEFLERVYGAWLNGNGLYRSHIKAWDLSLYQALYKIRDQIPNFETLLPPAQGRSVGDLAVSDAELLERKRKQTREAVARSRS